jgi:hypothetical protein
MSYIGNQPTSVAFITDSFSGTGSLTTFTMSVAPATPSAALVSISGVLQDPSTYSVSGLTLTFSAAPPVGTGNISVRYLGIPASSILNTAYRTVTELTATAGQTVFTPASYTAGFINVYRNGVRLGNADYTATSGTTVVLVIGANSGDLISTESFYVASVLNAIPATPGAVTSTYIQNSPTFSGNTTITTLNTPTGVLATQNGMTGIAKAWVRFAGATGTVASSFNISSVTRTPTGLYTIAFTTAMPDANYAAVATGSTSASTSFTAALMFTNGSYTATAPTTTSFLLSFVNLSASYVDPVYVNVAVFSL